MQGIPIKDCAEAHERKEGGIASRLRELGLLDKDGKTISPTPEFTASGAAQKRALKAEKKKKFLPRAAEKVTSPPELNERFREALRLMEDTSENLFITGKAGTGKSTLLSYFCRTTEKKPVVLAPTGVAALNVKGQTIHRFFNFYVDVTPEKIRQKKAKPRNAKLYKKLKTIIIDEISMVRADLLDCIDAFLRLHGPHPSRVFGGVQMIFVGDLYQLPPVVASQEREIFSTHYQTPYFFSAQALADSKPKLIELDKIYRQKDGYFVDLLNKIRNNSADTEDIARINSRLIKNEAPTKTGFNITLTTTNVVADSINDTHLAALKGKVFSSTARVEGDFGREYFPTMPELPYKIGAQIMMLNNDVESRWVNGSIGAIEDVKEDIDNVEYLTVRLQDHGGVVEVYPHTWEVYSFGVEENAITAAPVGAFTQYPFRLAWAITIHKSQGKTFERVVIDTGRGAFAAGQIYVALSRCTSFEGISLKTPLRTQDIRTDHRIFSFLSGMTEQPAPVDEKVLFIRQAIETEATLDITYLKADDTEITSTIIPLKVGGASYRGNRYEGMKAFCTLQKEELMFRVDRILKMAIAGRE